MNVRQAGLQEVNILRRRIEGLEALVEETARDSQELLAEYQSAIDAQETQANEVRSEFEANSEFRFEVWADLSNPAEEQLAHDISQELASQGFRPSGPNSLADVVRQLGDVPANHLIVTDASRIKAQTIREALGKFSGVADLPTIDQSEITWNAGVAERILPPTGRFFVVTLNRGTDSPRDASMPRLRVRP